MVGAERRARPARHARAGLLGAILICLGAALLAGAAYAYETIVRRPLSWPTVEARVVSSRVVNPRKPSQHQPEIVFELDDGGGPRRVTILSGWSSSSYDVVRAYVDAYPPDARVAVAVNPANRADVRYDLGPTLTNVLLPGLLGGFGAIFLLAGGLVWRRPAGARAGEPSPQALRWVRLLFAAIGLGALGLAVWLWRQGTPLDWPEIEATVVDGAVINVRSGRQTPPRPRYDIQVTFTFAVDGVPVTSRTVSGDSTTSRDEAVARLRTYQPGSRHRIRHRPGDPNVIRFDVSGWRERMLPVGLGAMGLIFLAFAAAMRRRPA
jgi:hypothetical protein